MLDNFLVEELRNQKILPVFNTSELDLDIKRLELLLSQNLNIKNVEITMRKINSLEIGIELSKRFPKIKFGLGSILSEDDYKIGLDKGFHFFVSPGIVEELVKNKTKNYIPGAETVSEFMYLSKNNYKIIKFFPSKITGGEKKLISIKNILKEVFFIPTGGVNLENYESLLSLENVLCVGMSKFDK